MKIKSALARIGLTETESSLYIFLLEKGVSSPPEITRGTDVSRSNAHHVLKQLIEKGLIKKQKKGKRFVYMANDPTSTIAIIERRRKVLEEALPDLQALYKQQINKPVVRFYDTPDEIKAIFEDILDSKSKEVFGFASTERLFEIIPNYFEKRFQPELKKREIFLRDILTHDSAVTVAKKTQESAKPYYEYRILPEKYEGILSDVLVWDDTVAIIALDKPVFATVLTNEQLARTFRAMFSVMWSSLKPPAREPASTGFV